MTLIDSEKLAMFKEQSAWLLAKNDEQRTPAEAEWLKWVAKRITELEGAK